jgi:hypothetical protein
MLVKESSLADKKKVVETNEFMQCEFRLLTGKACSMNRRNKKFT